MKKTCLAMAVVCLTAAARAQPVEPAAGASSGRTVQQWGIDEGLPNNALTSVIQTRDGYLWIGSWAGIARFDGVRFTPIAANLPNIHVRVLLEDRDGSVWIGTIGGGVARWRADRTQTFTAKDGLANDYVRTIAQDGRGRIWVTTDGGLSRIADGKVKSWTMNEGYFKDGLAGLGIGANGDAVVATSAGTCTVNGDALKCGDSRLFPRPAAAFFVDRGGHRWIGTAGAGVFETDAAGEPAGECATGCLPGKTASAFSQSRDGALWVGFAEGGVARLREGASSHYTAAEGLRIPGFPVGGIAEDDEGSIWLAPSTGGLIQLRPTRVTTYSVRDGLPSPAVGSVVEDNNGRIWAGSSCGPLSVLNSGRFEQPLTREMNGACAISVLASRDGGIWTGTEQGIFRWDGRRLSHFGRPEGLAELSVPVLFEDRTGAIWAATSAHLYRYVGARFERMWGASTDPGGGDIVSLAEDARGRLWIGSNGRGLSVYEHGAFRSTGRDVPLPTQHVAALMVDRFDDLWIGTADRGVFRLRNGRLDEFGPDQGLNDRLVAMMVEDSQSNIWVSTTRGIARLERARIEAVAGGAASSLEPVIVDRNDGLVQTEGMGGGFDPSGLRSKDGRLWFSTVAGLVVVDPSAFPINAVSPRPRIERVLVDGRPTAPDADGTITVPAGAETVEFSYTAFSFLVPSRVRFQYRLTGADSVWHDAGTRRSAAYNRIRPGRFTFELRASNNDNVWSDVPGTVVVNVLPRFWERSSVQVGSLILLMVATGIGVNAFARRRARRRVEELERDQALTRERTRIARDLHDDLGSRLAQIALIADGRDAAQSLDRISSTARDAMQTMDELVWSVNATNDTIESFSAYAAEFSEEHLSLAGLRVRFHIQPNFGGRELSADTRRHLFLAFKESVHNIVKHARASEVHIGLRIEGPDLVLEIADDGIGLSDDQPAGTGNGVRNMTERARASGGSMSVHAASGKGTRIVFRVPIG